MFLLDPLARLCLASLFLWSGFGKINHLPETTQRLAEVQLPYPELLTTSQLPYPQAFAAAAVVVEFGGAVALLLGIKTRLAAFALAVFTIGATLLFHRFWEHPDETAMLLDQIQFLKNVSILGGLLLVMRYGAGSLAFDRLSPRFAATAD